MKEVSCRVLDVLFSDLKRRGLPASRLVEGLPAELETLKNRNERISWDTYLQLMKNAEGIWSEEEFVELGGAFCRNPLVRGFTIIGRVLFSPSDFYLWIAKPRSGMGHQLFTCCVAEAEQVHPGRIQIRMRMESGYKPCRPFFLITKGAYIDIPRLIGFPSSRVEMREVEDGALFDIELPPGGAIVSTISRALAWPFVARSVAKELGDANQQLLSKYKELESARDVVEQQARQLRTAHAISESVHQHLDLRSTLDAVVSALVTQGGFAAARVAVTSDAEGKRIALGAKHGRELGDPGFVEALRSRGEQVGTLYLWVKEGSSVGQRRTLLGRVLPTIAMAIHDALTFAAVVDYRETLERKVEARTEELRVARDRLSDTVAHLEQAQAARDRIFANINHEIRTPLSLIALTVADLAKHASLVGDEGSANKLESIRANVRRLLHLVDSLLLLAAEREGKLRMDLAPADLGSLVRNQVLAWAPAADSGGLQLHYDGPERCVARIDRKAMERVVANLISNAIKFTSDGEIRVTLSPTGDNVVLAVRDTGPGIEPDLQARVFERFEQGSATPRSGFSGSGIGLSLVKEIAEAHGGQIQLQSTPGEGATFTVTLPNVVTDELPEEDSEALEVIPIRAPRSLPQNSDALQASAPKHGRTLLVAEDEPELLHALGEILSARYRVLLAPDGETALALAQKHYPDLLISDIGMPKMDGLELTKQFRALPGNRLAPVLLLTAYADRIDRLKGFDAGATDYVVKPFEPEELLARVGALLHLRDLAIRLHESEHLAALGTLSAGLAHEFRNPANALLNALGPLRAQLPDDFFAQGQPVSQLWEVLEDCAKQVAQLSTQLLGYSKGGVLGRSAVDVRDLVEPAMTLLGEALRATEVEVDIEDRAAVVVNAPFFVRALSHLLHNGAQAAGEGGKVRVRSWLEGDRCVIEVSDNGPGVPSELRSRIFEPFFTTKDPGEGSGMGLFTVMRIVSDHGGSLRLVDSDEGAVFRVELAAATSEERQTSVAAMVER